MGLLGTSITIKVCMDKIFKWVLLFRDHLCV
jgi:hypothetical protein